MILEPCMALTLMSPGQVKSAMNSKPVPSTVNEGQS